MQIVIETKNSKITTTCMKKNFNEIYCKDFRKSINILFNKNAIRFSIIYWFKLFEFKFFALFIIRNFWLIDLFDELNTKLIIWLMIVILTKNKIVLYDNLFNFFNYCMIYYYFFYSIIRYWYFIVFYKDTIFENENINVVFFDDIHI